jgi:transcription antitermination factor NusG
MLKTEQAKIYCVFCETGKEVEAEKAIARYGFKIIPSKTERPVVKNGKTVKVYRQILPGYVFFMADSQIDGLFWKELCVGGG